MNKMFKSLAAFVAVDANPILTDGQFSVGVNICGGFHSLFGGTRWKTCWL